MYKYCIIGVLMYLVSALITDRVYHLIRFLPFTKRLIAPYQKQIGIGLPRIQFKAVEQMNRFLSHYNTVGVIRDVEIHCSNVIVHPGTPITLIRYIV